MSAPGFRIPSMVAVADMVTALMRQLKGETMSKFEKSLLAVIQELIGHVERLEFQVTDLSKRPTPVDLEVAKRGVEHWKGLYEETRKELTALQSQRDGKKKTATR
jgi:hypothetical protein